MGDGETSKVWEELHLINEKLTTLITKIQINCPEQQRRIRRLELGFFLLLCVLFVFLCVEAKIAWKIMQQVIPLIVPLYP